LEKDIGFKINLEQSIESRPVQLSKPGLAKYSPLTPIELEPTVIS